jgi:hypothetical protein
MASLMASKRDVNLCKDGFDDIYDHCQPSTARAPANEEHVQVRRSLAQCPWE